MKSTSAIEKRLERAEQAANPENPPWGYGFLDKSPNGSGLVRCGDGLEITEEEFKRLYPNSTLVVWSYDDKVLAELAANRKPGDISLHWPEADE